MNAAAARASAVGKEAMARVAAAESSAAEWRRLAEERAAELLELRGERDAEAEVRAAAKKMPGRPTELKARPSSGRRRPPSRS